jgi:hypothetical protein
MPCQESHQAPPASGIRNLIAMSGTRSLPCKWKLREPGWTPIAIQSRLGYSPFTAW